MAGWIQIADDGQVELNEAARRQLGGRRFSLLVGPSELLLGVPDPIARVGSPPRALLAGDLCYVAFPEVVSLVAHTRISGVLRVMSASATRRVLFSEGEVRGASSERIGERLTEIIVRMGLVKREEMDEIAEEADGRRAGRLAVDQGLLSERELWNAVQEHVTTIFQAILLESRGSFVLADEVVEDVLTVPGLSAEGLLMEGVRRLDELRVTNAPGRLPSAERVIAAFAGAFRDIFATAEGAGAGAALQSAASSVFEDDPAHAGVFQGVGFSATGDLPEDELIARAREAGRRLGQAPEALLSDTLSTVMLFLLFVAGEHLDPPVHQALHARVKSIVARG